MLVKNLLRFIVFSAILSSTLGACPKPFQGFGIFLGQAKAFNNSLPSIRTNVLDSLYHDLGIRYLRSEYPPSFSPSKGVYQISCVDQASCTWITMANLLSSYPDIEFFISIWQPPTYMMTNASSLKPEFETEYINYLGNITSQAESNYNLTISRVSFVNEPEYFDAPWAHCFMLPAQVCRLARSMVDPRMKVCPETAYFWMAKSYLIEGQCDGACSIVATHGYKPWVRGFATGNPQIRVHFDLDVNENDLAQPVWITELASTLTETEIPNEMDFALDLASSLANFVGSTCVQRVYHWLAYTETSSSESLIWSVNGTSLLKPKKYYAFRHFTRSAAPGNRTVSTCSTRSYTCLTFDDQVIYINKRRRSVKLSTRRPSPEAICCTEPNSDHKCYQKPTELPAKSICSTATVAIGA